MSEVVEIVLEGPAKNALGSALMDQTIDALKAAKGAPLLIRGSGDAFSAGLNLKEIAACDEAGMRVFLTKLSELLDLIWRYPGPTVAAMNGHAIAGGALVALACDHRVVTNNPKARIGLNEVAIGVRFPPFILRLVQARIGALHMPEVVLGAHLFGPEDAVRVGLAEEVAEDVLGVAHQRLKTLARHRPSIYAATKAALRPKIEPTPEEERQFDEEVVPVWTGEELRASIHAMFAKK
ncbi:MAG: enoyl-CoA hydratase/isomerase family protein [Deltaproteobacteria bacterium]|nr:MAG: enoyl-CoA hydratase/isomerase family protein [Deltaproteobacteria bacterium]